MPPYRQLAITASVLTATSGLLLVVFATRADDEPPPEKAELIAIGPFNVGEWLDQSKRKIGGFADWGSPTHKEIIKSLNQCQAYIIDSHVTKGGKTVKFGEPRLVLAGKLYHTWESKKGKFSIQITTANAAANHTYYVASPAVRSVAVNIEYRTVGSSGADEVTLRGGFSPPRNVTYNVRGRLQLAK